MEDIGRILIVDDEMLTRQGLKHLISWEQEGFQIVGEASNGSEALGLIDKLKPHIIITDIVMPIMDGEEFTRIAKQRYPELEIIVLSSFGEFEYVRSTFQSGITDYILKPTLKGREFLKILKAAASRIPALSHLPSLDGRRPSLKQWLEQALFNFDVNTGVDSTIHEYLPYESCCFIGIDTSRVMYKDSRMDMVLLKVHEVFNKRLESAIYEFIEMNSGHYVGIVSGNNEELLRLKDDIQFLVDWAKQQELDLLWIIGKPFHRSTQLAQHYRDRFQPLFQYGFYLADIELLYEEALPSIKNVDQNFELNRFMEEMKRERFEEAFQYVVVYARLLAKQYRMEIFEYKSFLVNIIFNVTTILNNLGFESGGLEEEKYNYFKRIDEAKLAREALELLEVFLVEATQVICNKQLSVDPNMKLIQDYIHKHYAEPISLSGVAQHFHFNASYLSSYFAAHNKEGFSDYLNKVRVEKAAQLLQNDSTSIAEIGAMVGYSDQSYFTKVFKKWIGYSPSSYRKQASGRGEEVDL